MKKLVFGLIATITFVFNTNAQNISQNELREILAKGMVEFTNSLKPAFEKSKDTEDFKKIVTGAWYPKITREGNDLLNASYKLLSQKASNEEILRNYNGKEMAAAALYVDGLVKKGVKTDGSELFGGTTGDYNPYANTITARCRWYQIGCWIREIFGDEAGQALTKAIVDALIDLIRNL